MKLFIETLGCPKNFNDSESVAGIWQNSGMTVTSDVMDADVIMVNTCGFINDAKTESIDRIFDMARFIDERAEAEAAEGISRDRAVLVVSGCLSQRYSGNLYEEIPEIDVVLGVNEYERLPQIIKDYKASKADDRRVLCSSEAPSQFEEFSARLLADNPYTATLRIAEGCNNRCAYCVIPSIRGGYRSRPMENILAEAETLAAAGTKEVILIAQDITEYGRDIYGELKLPELLKSLCKVEGIQWIRLMYCYEDRITDELIEIMAAEEKICKYIDIPLQHVADNVLREMHRKSTSASIRNTLARLKAAMPDIHIRTTFITGFPGETEDDYEELLQFVEDQKFERLGVFPYSREEGTPAGDREDQIDEDLRAARAEGIMMRQVEISRELNASKIGQTFTVIVDGVDEEGAYLGRTQYDAPEIDNAVIFNSDNEYVPGDMVTLKVIDAFDYDLIAEEI